MHNFYSEVIKIRHIFRIVFLSWECYNNKVSLKSKNVQSNCMINMDMHLNRGMILKKMRLQGFILDVILFKYRAIRGSGTLFFFFCILWIRRDDYLNFVLIIVIITSYLEIDVILLSSKKKNSTYNLLHFMTMKIS